MEADSKVKVVKLYLEKVAEFTTKESQTIKKKSCIYSHYFHRKVDQINCNLDKMKQNISNGFLMINVPKGKLNLLGN